MASVRTKLKSESEINLEFGDWVREIRLWRGVTQKQLADRLGVYQNDVSRIETGKAELTLHYVAHIIRVLEPTPHEFMQFVYTFSRNIK
jgi:transcriptional regulator with XRE-family HTH domain